MSLEIATRAISRMSFNFSGILSAPPTNVSRPTGVVYDSNDAPPFINAEALIGGAVVAFNRVSLDMGLQIEQPDDPAATYGYGIAATTRRRITGSINPQLALLSTRNNMSDFLAGTGKSLVLRWGSAAGNRVSIYLPEIRYTGVTPSDVSGFASEDLAFQAVSADDGVYICVD